VKINKIRIGVLGCANIAVRSLIPELTRHKAFELVGVASRTKEKAAQIAAQYNCRPMTYAELVGHSGIDAIYIPLPSGLHAEWVCKSLWVGKHVLCEKSLGCTLSEVQDMISLARSKRLLVMENFQFRFHSQHEHVKAILSSGTLGEVRCFRASFGFPPFADGFANIRYNKELGGGALLDAGAYTIKATTFMLGKGFRVKAATLRLSIEYGVDVGGSIYLENGDGLVSETAFGFDNFYQCNYEIWGSKGKLTAKRAFTAPQDFGPELILETASGVELITLTEDNHFAKMLTHFAGTIERGAHEEEYEENLMQARLIGQVQEKIGC